MAEPTPRELITDWMHHEKFNHKGETKRKFYADLAHAKGVLKLAASDLKLNEETRKWVMGYMAALGLYKKLKYD